MLQNCFLELNELAELRDGAYENNRIYKERTKKWHDSKLRGDKDFKVGDKVLLFNFRFKLHLGKIKSKCYGPNTVKIVNPYGAIEITDKNRVSFKVNGQRLKKYYEGNTNKEDSEVVEFEGDAAYEVEDKSTLKTLLLADKAILSGADNCPPMLEKDMYDSCKSRMELYMLNRQHGRMILESVENGPLLWPTVE
nr:hypothetical protein [Tanacetum cinerariifolium]